MIPLCIPTVDKREIDAVSEVLSSGWLAHGPKNEEFERLFSDFIRTKYAVTLNSCATALHAALVALNITGEVLVPSFTFVASVNAIVTAGATPVFVDVVYDTGNMDSRKIEQKITKKTQAIMVVHFAGQAADMDPIMRIARKYNLRVIEDSAEAIGAEYKGKRTGSIGDVGCFSFFPTKNITTGEGGMITTNSKKLAERIRTISGHGISKTTLKREKEKKPWFRSATEAGYNFRMSNILAAIGVVQMGKLTQMNMLRRKHATYLSKKLSDLPLTTPTEIEGCTHVYQMYTICVSAKRRDSIVHALRSRGIGASVHFDPPVHQNYYYLSSKNKKDLIVTEKLSKEIITLPMYPGLRKEELDYIITSLQEIL